MGSTWVDTKKCLPEDIAEAMVLLGKDKELRVQYGKRALEVAKEWVDGASKINDILAEITQVEKSKPAAQKTDAILFAQHSSAGDVLMTTQCFKGIKQRHKGKRLIYMTQEKYQDVVHGNPYLDAIS